MGLAFAQNQARQISGNAGQVVEDFHAALDFYNVPKGQIGERLMAFTGLPTASAALNFIQNNGFGYALLSPIGNPFPGLTYTQSGNLTYFDSTGTLQTAAVDTMVLDYDPSTLALRGYPFWESRTNSIRNNTMVGAVAGVARNVGTPTSATRTASTTVVVASVGHTVSAGDMLTCSGASVAAYNGTFAVSAVVANVSFSYVVASSATDSASGFTYSVVSPGTLPTNWLVSGSNNGYARTIVGTGTENGIDYIDIRYAGLTTGATSITVSFEANTQVVATQNQVWTLPFYAKLAAGAWTNTAFAAFINSYTAVGVFDATASSVTGNYANPTSAGLATQRYYSTGTLASATAARVNGGLFSSISSGVAVDFTLRIGLPQLELEAFATPVIKTSTAAVTRAAPSCAITGASFSSWYNQARGTFVVQASSASFAADRGIFAVGDPSLAFGASETQYMVFSSALSGRITANVLDGGAAQVSGLGTITAVSVNTNYKAAYSYIVNNFNESTAGAAIITDSAGTLPTPTGMSIGMLTQGWSGATSYLNGWLPSLVYYAADLPSSLPSLST